MLDACTNQGQGAQRKLRGYRADMTDVAEAQHPSSKLLLDYWSRARAEGRLLTRDEIPGRAILHLMGNIALASPADAAGADWLIRLVGEVVTERFGGTPAGSLISEAHDPVCAESSIRRFQETARTGEPRILRGRFIGIERDFYDVENVHLPILGPDKRTIWILGGIFFFN
jgi:hypothetical protein